MYNILYIDNNINYYNCKLKKIITHKPYDGTLENGLIINTKKFYKSFLQMLKKESIKSGVFYDKLIIITPPNFNNLYRESYKNLFNNLNFKIILFKSETNFYEKRKNSIIINYNDTYFYVSYLLNNKFKSKVYLIDDLFILDKYISKIKNIYVYGKNDEDLIKKLEKNNKNFYVFEHNDTYFINKLI